MNNSLKRNTKEELYIFAPNLDFVLSHRRDLLNKLTNAYKITLFTDTSNFNNIVEANLSSLKIKNLKMRSHKRSLKILTSFTYMKSCLKKIQGSSAKKVIFITAEISLFGMIISRFLPAKLYFLITGTQILFDKNGFISIQTILKFVIKYLLKKDGVNFIFQNEDDKSNFKDKFGLSARSIIIEGSGVQIEKIKYISRDFNDEIKILFAGSLFSHKGVYEFYNAAKLLSNNLDNISFHIAGRYYPNNSQSITHELFQKIKNSDFITFHGAWNKHEFVENLKRFEIFILPSYGEGLPLSVIEAMLSGMPILASDVAGCKSCVENSNNGYLFKAKSISELVDAIKKITKNRNSLYSMGHSSREIAVQKFNLDLIYSHYISFLEN